MVLQNCQACNSYWHKNGRNVYGYQLLVRDQHIPEAHVSDVAQSSSSQPVREPPQVSDSYLLSAMNPLDTRANTIEVGDHSSANSGLRRFACNRGPKTKAVKVRAEDESESEDEDEDEAHAQAEDEVVVTVKVEADNDESSKNENVKQTHHISYFQAKDKAEAEVIRVESDNNVSIKDENDMPIHDEFTDEVESDYDVSIMDENVMMQTHPSWYFQLFKAAMDGDWESGEVIFQSYQYAVTAKIRGNSEKTLHVAVRSGHQRTILFIQNLLQLMSQTDLEVTNSDGCTSLAIAAKVGNVEAAKLLVAKNIKLLYISTDNKSFPIHYAAKYGQKEMLLYLLQVTQKGQSPDPDPYDPEINGPKLLYLIIKAELYDAALLLLQRMPELATSGLDTNQGLLILAQNPSAFSCWRNEGVLQPIIYSCVPELHLKHSYFPVTRDIENVAGAKNELDKPHHLYGQRYFYSGLQLIHQMLWEIFEKIVPFLNLIKSEKTKRHLAKKLVKCLCREASNNLKKSSDAALLFKMPLLLAAENGIPEIVKEITDSFPDAIWYHDDNNSEAFRLAIKYRHHEVYNLLYGMGDLYTNIVTQSVDVENRDNILHLAGYLAPSNRLRIVSGAAPQMQRELQWFKEIESLVQPAYKNKSNWCGQTPRELFTENHHNLLEGGEKWMRDTANSCTVAAALIATIAFAAAITVPGGNNGDNGRPMFGSEKAFIICGVADALSLFTSCASILMFLSILTSRFAEDDFLRALPTRLIVGLIALFISVADLMAAFSSTLYLMFGDGRRWILGCVIAPSCLLVAIFTSMHISLLGEIINNTYRCGIFKKKIKSRSHFRFAFWNSFWHRKFN